MAKMSTSMKTRRVPGPKPATTRNAGRSTRTPEKNYVADGIYKNSSFTHAATSLIGCTVHVQVKNGDIYDGILTTFSPDMSVVLKKVHKIPEMGVTTVPSRDLLQDTVVFNLMDIVAINAIDVDLEYAVKDSFTDSGISKYNGQMGEKELTPWESEGGEDLVLEGDPSNGWDPNEMFKTNREQFNVQSTYDDKLSQYTTVLEKSNSKEYRKREELASKMAQEIERTDGYRARIDLENGDGDEEDKFSAVIRPESQNMGNGTGKYIPPNRRNQTRQVPHGDGPGRASPSRNSQPPYHRLATSHPSPSHLQPATQPPPSQTSPSPSPHSLQSQVLTPPQTPPAKPTDTQVTDKSDQTMESPKVPSPEDSVPNTEPKSASSQLSPPSNKAEHQGASRDEQIRELKEFSTQFKLSESESKASEEKAQTGEERLEGQPEKKDSEQESKDKLLAEAVKKSTLNPNAKEFVFNPNAKSFQPKHSSANTPTPPRPQTQSPVITPHQQPLPMQYAFVPVMPQKYPKRAVVSVTQRSDFNAAAQAATGQPLLAQTTSPFFSYQMVPVQPGGMPQPTHVNYPQLMPVNHGTRMPSNVSVMSNNPQASQEHNPQAQYSVFMTPPVPAHLPHPGPQHPPTPAHINQHPGVGHHGQPQHHNAAGGQMGHQSGGHHPAPSPVQHHTGPNTQQGHPPNSGTPQPHLIFPNPGMGQQNHPPLQASPHNPTSPSSMHHLYTINHPPHGHSMQGGPPMSLQQSHPPSSGPHMMHAHSHGGPHQMMIPHQAHNQMQGPGQMQHNHQYPGHQIPAHVGNQAGPHVIQQPGMGVIPVSQSSGNISYIPHQVPNQGIPQVQSYSHNQ